jgi:Protein of unknown function (DUF3455)
MKTTATTKRGFRFLAAAVCLLAAVGLLAGGALAKPAPTVPGDPLDPRTYEPKSKVLLELHATGVQKYTCQANGTWLFTDPEATLYKANGAPKVEATHFLNFATGRPVWRHEDGSTIEAARTASASGGAGNIAWLLLQAAANTEGADGDKFTHATWVQRLNTSGGVAPPVPCTPGAQQAVPYTADYVFWKAPGHGHDD